MRKLNRDWRDLQKAIWNLVVVEDAFGLSLEAQVDGLPLPTQNQLVVNVIRKVGSRYFVFSKTGKRLSKGYRTRAAAERRLRQIEYFKHNRLTANQRFAFPSDPAKLEAFNTWLQEQFNAGVLAPDNPADPLNSQYVESAYKKGINDAYVSSRRAALQEKLPFYSGTREQFLNTAFSSRTAVEQIRMLSMRAFEELKGVTQQMGTTMNRTLADGFARGLGPREIARQLRNDVANIGPVRSERIARTEIVRAYAEGQLDSFDNLGVKDVGIQAEWLTAGDDRVCPDCFGFEGSIFPVEEARGLIPLHPLCRCAWVPAPPAPAKTPEPPRRVGPEPVPKAKDTGLPGAASRVIGRNAVSNATERTAEGRTIYKLEDMHFTRRASGLDDDFQVIYADVKKLDELFAKDSNLYIPRGGGGAEIAGRRADYIEFLRTGGGSREIPSEMSVLNITGKKDLGVVFRDGRHRFTVMRDAGHDKIPVLVPKSEVAKARKALEIPTDVIKGKTRPKVTRTPTPEAPIARTATEGMQEIERAIFKELDLSDFQKSDISSRLDDLAVAVEDVKDAPGALSEGLLSDAITATDGLQIPDSAKQRIFEEIRAQLPAASRKRVAAEVAQRNPRSLFNPKTPRRQPNPTRTTPRRSTPSRTARPAEPTDIAPKRAPSQTLTDDELREEILKAAHEIAQKKDELTEIGQAFIPDVRAVIEQRFGADAASRARFDRLVNDLRKRNDFRMLQASDPAKRTSGRLSEGIPSAESATQKRQFLRGGASESVAQQEADLANWATIQFTDEQFVSVGERIAQRNAAFERITGEATEFAVPGQVPKNLDTSRNILKEIAGLDDLEAKRQSVIRAAGELESEFTAAQQELKTAIKALRSEVKELHKVETAAEQNQSLFTRLGGNRKLNEARASTEAKRAELTGLRNNLSRLETEYQDKALKALRLAPEDRVAINPTGNLKNVNLDRPVNFIKSITDKRAIEQTEFLENMAVTEVKSGTRAFANGNRIRVAADTTDSVSAHEIGHIVENASPKMQKAARQFLDERIAATKSKNVRMVDLVKEEGGFAPSEIGNEDKFGAVFQGDRVAAAYTGKTYEDGVTEIISTGIELLYENSVAFARNDPEYFKFIVGILDGSL